jgi:hypothetical protein
MAGRTKVEVRLADAEDAHANDPQRAEVLRRTRAFKSSWIELAEALNEVRADGAWKRWGFESFQDYARKELSLRDATVEKLLGSFAFLRKRAPEVLERDGTTMPIPTYQAVDFVRRAYDEERAPKEKVEEVFHKVIEEGTPLAAVTREYKDTVFPIDEKTRKERDAAGVRNVAKRLHELLGETKAVPKALRDEAREVLERLLDTVTDKKEAA